MPQEVTEQIRGYLEVIAENKRHMAEVGQQLTKLIECAEADLRKAAVHVDTRIEHEEIPIAVHWTKAGTREWHLVALLPTDKRLGKEAKLDQATGAASCDLQSKAAIVQLLPRLVEALAEHTKLQRRDVELLTPFLDHSEGK